MSIRRRLIGALLMSGVVVTAGCRPGVAQNTGRTATSSAVPSATARPAAAPSKTTGGVRTPSAVATPSPPTGRRPTLTFGATGAGVKALQMRLLALHYDPGAVDGKYGRTTQMALFAFEKVNRLKITGTVGRSVWRALDAPRTPSALIRQGAADRVEIDLRRQLLYVYSGGELVLVSHISSGGGYRYCAKDPGTTIERCRYAVTPTGDFQTGRRVTGWDDGPLGRLYKPVYFNGGIAVHGYPSVPLEPASHGCVRVPMHTADVFQRIVGTGVAVYVRRPG